jgi:hypothetical protein
MRVTGVSEVAPHFQPRPPRTDDAGRLHRGGNPRRYAAAPLDLVARRPDLFGKPDRGMPSQSSLSANRRGKWNPANQAATCVETASTRRMMWIASARRRSTSSISGLDAQSSDRPKSRRGSTPTSGRSYRMSWPSLTRTAPALARSLSKPGKISPSAWRPPASRPCGCRSWGVPGREAANAVRRSRSKISTCSKYCAKAPAIDSPPIPPPTTTARPTQETAHAAALLQIRDGQITATQAEGPVRALIWQTAARSPSRNLLSFCPLSAEWAGKGEVLPIAPTAKTGMFNSHRRSRHCSSPMRIRTSASAPRRACRRPGRAVWSGPTSRREGQPGEPEAAGDRWARPGVGRRLQWNSQSRDQRQNC